MTAGTPGRRTTGSCWRRPTSHGSAGTTATCRCDPEPLAALGGGGARRNPPGGDRGSDVPLVEGGSRRSEARVRWTHAGAGVGEPLGPRLRGGARRVRPVGPGGRAGDVDRGRSA